MNFLPGQPLHLIQRGNNREAIFFGVRDYARCREWLAEAAAEYGCAIHACVLMTSHVHLLATPESPDSVPRTMQSLGRRNVRCVNVIHGRTGTLWAAPIDSEAYFLACCRYIELNPVRAGMVAHPRDYAWMDGVPIRVLRRDRPVDDLIQQVVAGSKYIPVPGTAETTTPAFRGLVCQRRTQPSVVSRLQMVDSATGASLFAF